MFCMIFPRSLLFLAFTWLTTLPALANSPRSYAPGFQRPKEIPYPKDNQFSPAREALGRTLFFDPRLSGSDWISCATCHNPAFSWQDGLPKAIGHGMKVLDRRTPTILNLAWGELMFWDGRSESLEAQALGPIAAKGEMNLPVETLLVKLDNIKGYKTLFDRAYPGEGISKSTIAKALANFQRTVISEEAPFDRWVNGNESAISENAKRGFVLFNEKALCVKCHNTWRFTDDGFHDIGVAGDDLGRGKIMPDFESMRYAFKTPTLRNGNLRAPFMHNGSETTLAAVVDFYDQGGRVKRPSISEHVRSLGLTPTEKADLIEFINTLTSADKPLAIPLLPQ